MTVVVVGLDGGSWNLLEPWIAEEELPNIERIRESGVYADLESCLPPVTSPNWKCYSTGKNPGKLGVYWWEIVDTEHHEVRTPRSSDYRSFELWGYLNDSNRQAAVINMPTTFPPRSIDGWMVAGGPGTESEGFARPDELESELREQGYSVQPREKIDSRTGDYEAAVDAHIEAIDSRFDVAERAIRSGRFDFVHITTFYINVLQHFFWNGKPTYRAWQRIDDRIGEILGSQTPLS
ncbi:alkaline phosphatase family protein [Saliphagus sp. GCM10025308]